MIITNKYNLPQTLVNVVNRPQYSKGNVNLSVTEMMNSPKISILRKKYDDQIEIDVSDMLYSMAGTALHNILEKGADENHIVEERLFAEFDGWTISGAIDLQIIEDAGIEINDYKNVGVWSVQNPKPEWEEQLNVYAWLVEEIKKTPVTTLKIIAFLRDFSAKESKFRANYPKSGVVTIDIPVWSMGKREEYIRGRILEHSNARFAEETGGVLPPCTPSEMWEKDPVYAVKKDGAVRAKLLHATMQEAEESLEKLGKGFYIETRKGERTRCENYCPVNQFCDQYKLYLEEQKNENTPV